MRHKDNLVAFIDYLGNCVQWLILSVITGIAGGAVGVTFYKALALAGQLCEQDPRLIWCLPVFGLLITFLYQKSSMLTNRGTNGIFEAVRAGHKVHFRLTWLVYVCTFLTHLGGGSAGREGAALQIGGSIGNTLARMAKMPPRSVRILTMCGMSAMFSTLFNTPLTAAIFCMEIIDVGVLPYAAMLPCLCSAMVAYYMAGQSGIHPHFYHLPNAPQELLLSDLLGVLMLGLACGLCSILLCETMHKSGHILKKRIKSPYLRIFAAGCVVIMLTLLVGSTDYNGAGMELAERAIHGDKLFAGAFLLKLLFTAITMGAGYQGGEIVPTLCIGATLGSVLGGLLGLDPGFAAALGMIGVFCGAVNCPLASIMLSIEFFGSSHILYFALICAVSYLISGRFSLYTAQKIVFSKLWMDDWAETHDLLEEREPEIETPYY